MTRVAVIVATVSALFLGMSMGCAGGLLFSHFHAGLHPRFVTRGFRGDRRGPPGIPSPPLIVPHLVRMLDLTPAQADAIRDEIEASRSQFAAVRDSLHERIERHLTAAQRQRWRDMVVERYPGETRGRAPHREGDEPR